ncbi:MAG TPA: M1 family metallopeptidase [Acidimicrobiales bacterium]|nr:M1 family metallopeptidase [Acidimicrobiales bacterium]
MPDTPPSGRSDEPYRLPRTVTPLVYHLTLDPDLEAAVFSGDEMVELTVHEPTATVVLNAADLVITDASVESADGDLLVAEVTYDEKLERATFSLPSPVPAGPALLRCRFTGILNDKLRGFYRSRFRAEDGTTATIATSQMESTDARRAFPCWDEPDRKAGFDISLVAGPGLSAYSNGPAVEETDLGGGRRLVRFAPTMKMSTYLVALIVGPLAATEPVDVDGVPVRVVHPPGRGHLSAFALEVAAHALRYYSDYFAIPYPGDKLDLVAIPDFAFGAMENLGCVTFRETALLVDEDRAARTELERVCDVVCHEIAHMWFGDLVTMRWWNGIWLNEAFATFMEVLATDAFRPGWHRWVSFGLERESALAVDGLHATRPIEYPVGSPEEADGMFDVLTYQKGGSVLRMLEQYLGPETFRDGVRSYLAAHAYANTDTADLWDALEAVSGQPVRVVMDSWILQGGHPLVTLDDGLVDQQPFAYGPPDPDGVSAIGGPWQVPVLVRALPAAPGRAPGPGARLLLGDRPEPVPALPDEGPALVNAGGWGVYRVGYGGDQLGRLAGRLDDLAELERVNLLTDTWALVLAGHRPLDDAVTLAAHLGDHSEPGSLAVVAGILGLCDRVVGDADRPAVARATRALLGPRLAGLGWDRRPGDDERAPTLRAMLIRTLATVGQDPGVRTEAAARFDAAAAGRPAIAADIEGAVLDAVAAELRPGDDQAFLEHYRHPADPQDEARYLFALAAFPDEARCLAAFDLALGEVRTQNAPYLIRDLLANRVGGPAVWGRLKEEWTVVTGRFPANALPRMLDGVRMLCGRPELADDVIAFLEANPLETGGRTVLQVIERLGINVAFGRREAGRIAPVLDAATGGLR